MTGDEAQIFIRRGAAPVGIGAHRWETGRLLRSVYGVDRVLLDDGFQHVRLARNVDIVLIDALHPFGGGHLFPLGRLRELPAALARANIILITRSDLSDATPVIERVVREWNREAPIFHARVEPEVWVEHRTGRRYPLDTPSFQHPGGFCGLGNPLSFRRTLERLGVPLAGWVEFSDHHHYRPSELRRLARQFETMGADALVTTEKDTVNLCEACDDLLAPLPLYWLQVGITIDREDMLLEWIEKGMQ